MAFIGVRQFGDEQACKELVATLNTVKGVENLHMQGKDVCFTVHDLNEFFSQAQAHNDLNWIEYCVQMDF